MRPAVDRSAERVRVLPLRSRRPGTHSPSSGPVPPVPDASPFRVVAQRHRPRDAALRRYLAVADLAALSVVQTAAILLVARPSDWPHVAWAGAMLPAWLVLFKAYGLYDRDVKRISHTTLDDLPGLFHGVVIGTLAMLLWFEIGPVEPLPAGHLIATAAVAVIALLTVRATARRIAGRRHGSDRVLLIGARRHVDPIARKMRSHADYRLQPVGVLDTSLGNGSDGLPSLGLFPSKRLANVLREHAIDRVVVSQADVGDEELLALIHRCRELSVKVSVLPQVSDAMGPSVEIDDIEGVTVLGIAPPVLSRTSRVLKRTLDIVGSAVLLVVTAPVALACAIAVKVDSEGAVLFTQDRVGRRGRHFKVLKFRTMCRYAEAQLDALMAESRNPNWLLLESDPRITRVGGFLRRTSLDELPQLWNVLKGEMSLVGPRPIVPSEFGTLNGWHLSRVDLPPGITGLWQVLGRTNIPFEEMITLDYLYVTNWSLWTDLRLLVRTLPVVLTEQGVN